MCAAKNPVAEEWPGFFVSGILTLMEAGQLKEHIDAGPVADGLINQYGRMLEDSRVWREQISMDGLVHTLDNGVLQSHPLVDRVLRAEWTMLNCLRSIQRIVDVQKAKAEEDEFDAFLRANVRP
jgi:hypothetical protein